MYGSDEFSSEFRLTPPPLFAPKHLRHRACALNSPLYQILILCWLFLFQLSYADIAFFFNSSSPPYIKVNINLLNSRIDLWSVLYEIKKGHCGVKFSNNPLIDIVYYCFQAEIDWEKYPKLKAVHDNVSNNPGIAKWMKERPQTMF